MKDMREETGIDYGSGGGRPLWLDLLGPDPAPGQRLPAVVYVHGGGWAGGERTWNPNRILADAGFVTVSVSYRFTGEAIFPAQIHDVKAAIRWVRANADDLGIDPDRIGLWGHSAGGHLALLAAMTGNDPALEGDVGVTGISSAVRAVVAGCTRTEMLIDWYAADGKPFPEAVDASLSALLGGPRREMEDVAMLASPFWHLRPGVPPALLQHGTDDETVPINQAWAFVARSRAMGNDAVLMELPGVGHDANTPLFPGNPDPYGAKDRTIAFFDAHLR